MRREKLIKTLKNSEDFKLLIRINHVIFPFFCPLIIVMIFTESYTYSGFLANKLIFPLWFFMGFFIICGFLTILPLVPSDTREQMSNYYNAIFMANRLLLFAGIFEIGLMLAIEKEHFVGYVYTRFLHIEPSILSQIILVGLVILAVDMSRLIFKAEKKYRQSLTLSLLITALTIWVLASHIPQITFHILTTSRFILAHPTATYAEKMRIRWESYDFWMYINRYTPEDSTIMIAPKMSPWLVSGNLGLVRYFLYPRYLVNSDQERNAPINPEADFALIDWGTWG